MDPVLITIWLVGLIFFVAGLLTYRYVIGRPPRHTRNSWDAPEIRVWKDVETEPTEEPQTGLDIWHDLEEMQREGQI